MQRWWKRWIMGGVSGGIYDHQLGVFGTRVWRACVFFSLGWEENVNLLYYKRTYVSSWLSVRCQIDFWIHLVRARMFLWMIMILSQEWLRAPAPCMSQVDTGERHQGRVGICWCSQDFGWFVSKMAPNNPQNLLNISNKKYENRRLPRHLLWSFEGVAHNWMNTKRVPWGEALEVRPTEMIGET